MERIGASYCRRRGTRALWCAIVVVAHGTLAWAQWPQWGGPHRDFKADSTGLADSWPVQGPKVLWDIPHGGGRAGILVVDDFVYMMHYANEECHVTSRQLDHGKRQWIASVPVTPLPEQRTDSGAGPIATPVWLAKRLIFVDFTGKMWCLKTEGKTGFSWAHELVHEFDGKVYELGYSASPLAYQKSVIVLVGGKRFGVIAFNGLDGSSVWTSVPLDVSYASPILINVDGQDQIVVPCAAEVVGLDANSGALLWRRPHPNRSATNWFTPVWGKDNLLFVSSHGDGGSRVLKLNQKNGKTTVTDVWHNRDIGFHRTSAVRIGDYIYGCAGEEASNFLVAINVKTGKIAWREPGFPMGNCVYADGKVIILDEQGMLSLVTVSPEKLTVHSSVPVLEPPVRTAPTVVGNRLFIRDQKNVKVLDIGKARDG